jgi:predicted phage terminase large subunit-like protein
MQISELRKLAAAEMLERREARRSVAKLFRRIYPHLAPEPFHRQYAAELDRFIVGTTKVLIVNMPPGHAKSMYGSLVTPAAYMGVYPDGQFIGGSYNTDLAKRFGREVRNIVAGPDYRAVYPGTWLRKDSKSAGRWNTNQGGSYISAAVNKPVTGWRGSRLSMDDPHANFTAGNDQRQTERDWQWFGELYTRGMPGFGIHLIMQRMSPHDQTARLLKLMKAKGLTPVHLNFPAISDPKTGEAIRYDGTKASLERLKQGKALWGGYYDIKAMVDQAYTLGPSQFNAMFQQMPDETSGRILQPHWMMHWCRPGALVEGRIPLPKRWDYQAQSWDMRFMKEKRGSYVVGQVWGFSGEYKYLLDQVRGQWGFEESVQAVLGLSSRWPQATLRWVEDKANGPAIEDQLKKKLRMKLVKVAGDKGARMRATEADWCNGLVLLPPPEEDEFEWVPGLRQRLLDFPDEPNDEGDCASQALNQHRKRGNFAKSLE